MKLLLISLLALQTTIQSIPTPAGFTRVQTDGFGTYLRNLKLKADKTVYLYNHKKKINQDAQYAVIDMTVGDMDLQQCADAVMRLRAEYLFEAGRPQDIRFTAVNGSVYQFAPPYTHSHLIYWLEVVFMHCNSFSLQKEVKKKNIHDIAIGDIFCRGGFPGHVEIVVDVAVNSKGQKIFMLAQSYMPAQDIHVLNGEMGPWYVVKDGTLDTPEYVFDSTDLYTW